MEDEKTITLRKPITLGKGDAEITYSELKLREPTMGELRKAAKAGDSLDMLHSLIQQVASIPAGVVDRIGQRDMEEAGRFFAQFSKAESSPDSATEAQN